MIVRSFAMPRLRHRVVGVITSPAELDFAIRMGKPPDFFELRLDRLVPVIDRLENKISKLRAPLIITARHPMEGGANRLSAAATTRSSCAILIPGSLYRCRITLAPSFEFAASAGSKAERAANHFSALPEKHSDSQSVARQSARGKDVWRGYLQAGNTHRYSGATDAIDRFRHGQGP